MTKKYKKMPILPLEIKQFIVSIIFNYITNFY